MFINLLPASNLTNSVNFPVAKSTLTVSLTLTAGSGVADSTPVMGDDERNTLCTELDLSDLAEFVLALFSCDAVDGVTTFGVVDETEVLSGLLDGDDVHESGRVVGIRADLSVDLDETLHDDGRNFLSGECVLESVTQEDYKRK